MKSCCEQNGFEEGGCNGRGCPAGRIDLGAAWRYVCGYVPLWLRYRDHKAAKYAGHLAAVTQHKSDGIEFVGREPMDMQAVVIWSAFFAVWALVIALMYSDDLVQMWPRMVAALSIG